MTIRLYCGHCRAKRQHRGNGVAMMICVECGRYRDLPSPAEKDNGRRALKALTTTRNNPTTKGTP